jgi:hypothetical protein
MKYPKINSLYKREYTTVDPKTGLLVFLDKGKSGNRLIEGDYACPEFESIKYWTVTEKIDGTNIRIQFSRGLVEETSGGETLFYNNEGTVEIRGRTDNATLQPGLLELLSQAFTVAKFQEVFEDANDVVLFGEGFGGKIQLPPGKRDNPYGKELQFALFDVRIDGIWLERANVGDVANKFNVETVPLIGPDLPDKFGYDHMWTKEQIVEYVKSWPISKRAWSYMEGIVARSEPLMRFRTGTTPIMFKLRCQDFPCNV